MYFTTFHQNRLQPSSGNNFCRFKQKSKRRLNRRFDFYVVSFFIPKIILKIPLKNLGLLKITTFIKLPPLIFRAGNSEYYHPYCQNRNKKFRRAKTTYQQTDGKCYCYNALIICTVASAHYYPLRYYIIVENGIFCYKTSIFISV